MVSFNAHIAVYIGGSSAAGGGGVEMAFCLI